MESSKMAAIAPSLSGEKTDDQQQQQHGTGTTPPQHSMNNSSTQGAGEEPIITPRIEVTPSEQQENNYNTDHGVSSSNAVAGPSSQPQRRFLLQPADEDLLEAPRIEEMQGDAPEDASPHAQPRTMGRELFWRRGQSVPGGLSTIPEGEEVDRGERDSEKGKQKEEEVEEVPRGITRLPALRRAPSRGKRRRLGKRRGDGNASAVSGDEDEEEEGRKKKGRVCKRVKEFFSLGRKDKVG